MSKPCYTCTGEFITGKRQHLLNKKIEDAQQMAKKNNYSGVMAIVALSSGDGFAIRAETEGFDGWEIKQYLLFNKGNSI